MPRCRIPSPARAPRAPLVASQQNPHHHHQHLSPLHQSSAPSLKRSRIGVTSKRFSRNDAPPRFRLLLFFNIGVRMQAAPTRPRPTRSSTWRTARCGCCRPTLYQRPQSSRRPLPTAPRCAKAPRGRKTRAWALPLPEAGSRECACFASLWVRCDAGSCHAPGPRRQVALAPAVEPMQLYNGRGKDDQGRVCH